MASNKFNKGGSSLADLKQNLSKPTENAVTTSLNDEILELDPSIIKTSRYQKEYELDENVDDLLESFPLTGQLEYAIARRLEDGSIELIAGHRRRLACLRLGIKLKTIIKKYSSELQAELDYLESNKFREIDELTKARMYNRQIEIVRGLRDQGLIKGKATAIVAKKLGVSEKTVQRTASLDRLIPELKALFVSKEIAKGVAFELSLLDEATQNSILESFKDLTSITTEDVQQIKDSKNGFTEEERTTLIQELSDKNELVREMTSKISALSNKDSEHQEEIKKTQAHYQTLIDNLKKESNPENLKKLNNEIDELQKNLLIEKNKNVNELNRTIMIRNNNFIFNNVLHSVNQLARQSANDLSFDKDDVELDNSMVARIDSVQRELQTLINRLNSYK